MAKRGSSSSNIKVISTNKKARFNYQIIESFEAGIVLSGAEIKSIRRGSGSLNESYVAPKSGELFLIGAHIAPYAFDTDKTYDPRRPRKLLMHKREILKLTGRVEQKGHTIIPLKLYLKKGLAKLEIALGKGKASPDKRNTIKAREADLEAERAMKRKYR